MIYTNKIADMLFQGSNKVEKLRVPRASDGSYDIKKRMKDKRKNMGVEKFRYARIKPDGHDALGAIVSLKVAPPNRD